MSEAKRLTEDSLREVVAMPFTDLVGLIEHPVEADVMGLSGRKYRVRTYSFWDMDPYESELFTRVQVTGRGLRRYQRYFGIDTRLPNEASQLDTDLTVSSSWTETGAWLALAFVVLLLVAPWFVGVAYLISRVL
jgi:hypothetical protein